MGLSQKLERLMCSGYKKKKSNKKREKKKKIGFVGRSQVQFQDKYPRSPISKTLVN